jgi:S1/P1 Nuclease
MMKALLALLLFALPLPAWAWSHQSHMATGAIAYDQLARENPAAIAAIVAIMAQHPDKARFDRNLAGLSGPARDRALFMWMARWPDDVRETPYDRPKWHYYGRVVSGWTRTFTFHVGDADKAHPDNLAIARDAKRSPADRAVALCWLFHITGDMHQPLHAGHQANWRFPFTDRLGTIAWIRKKPRGTSVELHQLWDKALDQPGDDVTGAPVVAAMAKAVPLSDRQRGGDFALWTAETAALARRIAYAPYALTATRDPSLAPVIPPSELDRLHRIARVRVAQAGERLGGLLATIPAP